MDKLLQMYSVSVLRNECCSNLYMWWRRVDHPCVALSRLSGCCLSLSDDPSTLRPSWISHCMHRAARSRATFRDLRAQLLFNANITIWYHSNKSHSASAGRVTPVSFCRDRRHEEWRGRHTRVSYKYHNWMWCDIQYCQRTPLMRV